MFILPKLPYGYAALAPTISATTLHTHHDKHHRTYVDTTNKLAAEAGLAGRPLEEVIREAHRKSDQTLFHNAAQAWNHAFYWTSMAPRSGWPPTTLRTAIDRSFGDLDGFKEAFVEEGAAHFGSGWAWLVLGSEGLSVISTHDADDTLVREGLFPLLVCDLWEHAYYLDYKNDRKTYLQRWLDQVANLAFAEQQLNAANGQSEAFRYPAPTTEDDERKDRAPVREDRPHA